MKKLIQALAFAASFLAAGAVLAQERGTPEQATAMVKKAIAFLKANGKEKAFAEFNNPKGQFSDRDLYIFVQDLSGKMLAHGGNARLIDKDLSVLRDEDGRYFVKSMIELANTKGKGWVDYRWSNPVTKVIEQKSSYIEKADDIFIGCGIYKS